MDNEEHSEDYDVGYRRPPKKNQFKKGHSGNPNGRPKGAKGVAQIIEQVCRELITVKGEDGRQFKIPKMQAVMMQLMNQALKGDVKAMRTCFEIMRMFPNIIEPPRPQPPTFVVSFVKSEHQKLKDKAAGIKCTDDEEKVQIPFEEWRELQKYKD